MCGFSGILFTDRSPSRSYSPGLDGFRRAAALVAHRGTTDQDEYIASSLWLNHYRLAFQDVSAGRQPMVSGDGRHVIVFNGEVYNHLHLRADISKKSGHQFKTRSDTETLIEGWKAFGPDFFQQLDGEYALVISAIDGSGFVAHRDYFGVKPLFLHLHATDTRRFARYQKEYLFNSEKIEFASEIKGLTAAKCWQPTGLLKQFVGLYEPICTPFENIIHLPAGAILTGTSDGSGLNCRLVMKDKSIRHQSHNDHVADEHAFEQAFSQSVADRLLSDVELGIYLSGGVDSRAVGFELQRIRGKNAPPLKSFTIGFTQQGYDETDTALEYARHMGFDPQVVRVDADALNYAYPLAVHTSELVQPFTNGAAKWWLSRFTRQWVQGVLTGDGADELLCGYPSYRYSAWWKHAMAARGPIGDLQDLTKALHKTPLSSLRRDALYQQRFAAHAQNPWLSGSSSPGDGTDFIYSLHILGVPHPLFGQIRTIAHSLLGEQTDEWLAQQASDIQSWYLAGLDDTDTGQLFDPAKALLLWQNYFAHCHLPVLILNWVGDRMEMANTLEGRTPFLSRHMRQLVIDLPDRAMVSGLKDKVLLRRTYERLFPAQYARQAKKQFNAPFLDAQSLIDHYQTENVFAACGLGTNKTWQDLQKNIHASENSDSYRYAHLQSAKQTAIAMSILHHSLVLNETPQRDESFEQRVIGAR